MVKQTSSLKRQSSSFFTSNFLARLSQANIRVCLDWI